MGTTIFDRDELDLIVEFAGCSLDEKPGKNWVEGVGGLPEYICRIARAVKRTGKTTSQAIAIAVARVKKWAAGADNVNADTRAKAAKAVAEWESKKARSKTKSAGKRVAASHADHPVLCLAATSFNVDTVRTAFDARQREARRAYRQANPSSAYDDGPSDYLYVKEQWTDYIIAATGYGEGKKLYKVPYAVDDNGNITFSDAVEVKTMYVTVEDSDIGDDGTLSDADLQKIMQMSGPCPRSAAEQLLELTTTSAAGTADPLTRLSQTGRSTASALERVIALANEDKPHGDVAYADPGYKDGKKRYPVDTAAHVRAAWSYINQKDNQAGYTSEQLAAIKSKIQAAAKRFNITISA